MNPEQITDGITIIFDGRDSVHIDMWAIQMLNFDVISESYILDSHRHTLLKKKKLSYICMKFDLSKPLNFSHKPRFLAGDKTIEQDGLDCIESLIGSDDIVDVCINGVSYLVPQDLDEHKDVLGIPFYTNKAQKNTLNEERHTLTINIGKENE